MRKKIDYRRRLIACLVLFALVYAQFAISAHAVFHPDHYISSASAETGQGHDEDGKKHNKHKCPECLLAKSFQTAFADSGSLCLAVLPKSQTFILSSSSLLPAVQCASYSPRAPPAFLV